MRAVIQRVSSASVKVEGELISKIGEGFLLLLGVLEGDSEQEASLLAAKTAALRVFSDAEGKMNRSILDVGGDCLVVSQFTLCADCKKGNRPSFSNSAQPREAERLYEFFMEELGALGVREVKGGQFAASMEVSLVNEGPVTILFDTDTWLKKK